MTDRYVYLGGAIKMIVNETKLPEEDRHWITYILETLDSVEWEAGYVEIEDEDEVAV